jgi:hypothetical protein
VALCEFTGSPVTGVFQTLSAGKSGQFVPGMSGPRVARLAACPFVERGALRAAAFEQTIKLLSTSNTTPPQDTRRVLTFVICEIISLGALSSSSRPERSREPRPA